MSSGSIGGTTVVASVEVDTATGTSVVVGGFGAIANREGERPGVVVERKVMCSVDCEGSTEEAAMVVVVMITSSRRLVSSQTPKIDVLLIRCGES